MIGWDGVRRRRWVGYGWGEEEVGWIWMVGRRNDRWGMRVWTCGTECVAWCGVVECGVIGYGVVECGVVECGVIGYGVVECGRVWSGRVWCDRVWCGRVW